MAKFLTPLRRCAAAALMAGALLATAAPALSEKPPQEWDGLVRRDSKQLDNVYVRPGVTFNAYKQVRLLPVDVEFDKDWDPNSNTRSMSRRLSDHDIERIRTELAAAFREEMAKRLAKGGYEMVDTNGGDVLAVKAGLINVYINAPDTMSAGRSRSYVMDAGRITLLMQIHDSVTGQLLARAVDTQSGTNMGRMQFSNSVTNSAEARRIFDRWADALVRALDQINGKIPAK